ncbi:MAG TPA: hypothetical protein VFB00_06310 [Terriglobales bacterium]|nr:hypothetical protein [Terriglobales bacterium]
MALVLLPAAECQTISVRVFDRSALPFRVLLEGEKTAAEVLASAGVQVAWLNCQAAHAECRERPTQTKLVLTILKSGSPMAREDVLGLAAQDSDGSGAYCYIFRDKLEQVSGTYISAQRLLGYAMAHEIGHLIKGSHSHSPAGVMSAVWSRKQLQLAARGALGFTPEEAAAIRARLWSPKQSASVSASQAAVQLSDLRP